MCRNISLLLCISHILSIRDVEMQEQPFLSHNLALRQSAFGLPSTAEQISIRSPASGVTEQFHLKLFLSQKCWCYLMTTTFKVIYVLKFLRQNRIHKKSPTESRKSMYTISTFQNFGLRTYTIYARAGTFL